MYFNAYEFNFSFARQGMYYTAWPKPCWHPNTTPICYCWTFYSKTMGINLLLWYNSFHSCGKAFYKTFEPGCRDLLPSSHKSISEGRHWCWTLRHGLQLAFQFISEALGGIEVKAWAFVHCHAFLKLLPQSWKHPEISLYVLYLRFPWIAEPKP